jgi:hypothetical protein
MRALDTDVLRRYRNANDLLENLLEAFEDDRWDIADKAELVRSAGLSRADSNLDDATEDLLASLGNNAVQVTPTRPSMELRVERASSSGNKNQLDALLADLDDGRDLTAVEDRPFRKDPISELIHQNPRKSEAIVQIKARVPSLDDPDDTPLPAPRRDSEPDIDRRPISLGVGPRSGSVDEAAALDAISGLDEPIQRVSSAAEQATSAAERLEAAASRAERAAVVMETGPQQQQWSTRRTSTSIRRSCTARCGPSSGSSRCSRSSPAATACTTRTSATRAATSRTSGASRRQSKTSAIASDARSTPRPIRATS